MTVWLVSFFENTPIDDNQNTRYNALVKEALQRNHHVVFWASTFKHNTKSQRFDKSTTIPVQEGLTLTFIRSQSYQKNIGIPRLYSHFVLGKDVVKAMESAPQKPDVVVMAYPPISTAYEVVRWCKGKDIPIIIDIIDPWPELFERKLQKLPKPLSKLIFSPQNKKAKFVFQNATAVTAISNQYLDWAKKYEPAITTACFYPAIDGPTVAQQLSEAAQAVPEKPSTFKVIYAGSLGYSYDIPCILEAAQLLQHETDIQFAIAGLGPQQPLVENAAQVLPNLTYLGRLSKTQLMLEYYTAHVGLTQHVKGATQSVTYKLFDLLSCGLPIINSLESEMKAIIVDNTVGFHHNPGDARALAEAILTLKNNPERYQEMRQNAKALFLAKGDSQKVYAQFLDFIEANTLS
ncbi:glycosyltransferase family 4 protein [Flavobacterium sedimenticola]|uniref:Glycosyltransferase family 4 protein n=1 Tax=Flavobacterium sedimenticola TaxID=3043286 RepID=A0ABT6XRH5_9FLAO|nr:glycosyltransferase family 4 protein [Flavobacterium sedimenticola]MDI9257698.1 glycosyltransferase family 4 protein [Flavobacterium sedimenticola]